MIHNPDKGGRYVTPTFRAITIPQKGRGTTEIPLPSLYWRGGRVAREGGVSTRGEGCARGGYEVYTRWESLTARGEEIAMGVTVNTLSGERGTFLYCPEDGEQYSATPGDYFWKDPDEVFVCSEGHEMAEVRRITTYEEVAR